MIYPRILHHISYCIQVRARIYCFFFQVPWFKYQSILFYFWKWPISFSELFQLFIVSRIWARFQRLIDIPPSYSSRCCSVCTPDNHRNRCYLVDVRRLISELRSNINKHPSHSVSVCLFVDRQNESETIAFVCIKWHAFEELFIKTKSLRRPQPIFGCVFWLGLVMLKAHVSLIMCGRLSVWYYTFEQAVGRSVAQIW